MTTEFFVFLILHLQNRGMKKIAKNLPSSSQGQKTAFSPTAWEQGRGARTKYSTRENLGIRTLLHQERRGKQVGRCGSSARRAGSAAKAAAPSPPLPSTVAFFFLLLLHPPRAPRRRPGLPARHSRGRRASERASGRAGRRRAAASLSSRVSRPRAAGRCERPGECGGRWARAGRGAASAARLTGARPAGGGAAPQARQRLGPRPWGRWAPGRPQPGVAEATGRTRDTSETPSRPPLRPGQVHFPAKVARGQDAGLGGPRSSGLDGDRDPGTPPVGDPARQPVVAMPVLSVCFFWLF